MKYIRRLLWFVATRLVMISAIVALLTLVFYLAMNTAKTLQITSMTAEKRNTFIQPI